MLKALYQDIRSDKRLVSHFRCDCRIHKRFCQKQRPVGSHEHGILTFRPRDRGIPAKSLIDRNNAVMEEPDPVISPCISNGTVLLDQAYLTELFVEVNQEHQNESITVDTLANYFFMSRYYFMHPFKRCSGSSVHGYITRIRLDAANEMIQNGASFTTASIRIMTGKSPEYRQSPWGTGCFSSASAGCPARSGSNQKASADQRHIH